MNKDPSTLITLIMSGKVKIRDPIIAGIAIRNENRPASSLDIPIHNAVEIVIPDLDIPGNKAKACIIPIINAETKDIFFFLDLWS